MILMAVGPRDLRRWVVAARCTSLKSSMIPESAMFSSAVLVDPVNHVKALTASIGQLV